MRKLVTLGVNEGDVLEKFVRSQGPGGQNVQKNSTCVFLKHLPTGIGVKCQEERSQLANRLKAWSILLDKIEALRFKKITEERSRLEKLRRRNRKRPLTLKLRILEVKRRQSQKKLLRAKVREVE